MSHAKTTVPIEMFLSGETRVGSGDYLLDGATLAPRGEYDE